MEAAKSAVEAGAGEAASSDSVTITSSTTNGISATATVSGATPEAPAATEGSDDTAGSLEQLINNIQEETKAATDQAVETAEDLLNTGAAAVEEVVTPEATTEPEPEPAPETVEVPSTNSVEAPQP